MVCCGTEPIEGPVAETPGMTVGVPVNSASSRPRSTYHYRVDKDAGSAFRSFRPRGCRCSRFEPEPAVTAGRMGDATSAPTYTSGSIAGEVR